MTSQEITILSTSMVLLAAITTILIGEGRLIMILTSKSRHLMGPHLQKEEILGTS